MPTTIAITVSVSQQNLLLNYAQNIGIIHARQKDGTYKIDPASCAVDALCPSFISRGNNGGFSPQAFYTFLEFLHQPLRVLASRADATVSGHNYNHLQQLLSNTSNQASLVFADDEHERVEHGLAAYIEDETTPDLKLDPMAGFVFERLPIENENTSGPLSQWYNHHLPRKEKHSARDLEKIADAFFKTPKILGWLQDETQNVKVAHHIKAINDQACELALTSINSSDAPETAKAIDTLLAGLEHLLRDEEWTNAGHYLHRSRPYPQILQILQDDIKIARAVLKRLELQPLTSGHLAAFGASFMPLLSVAHRLAFGADGHALTLGGLTVSTAPQHLPEHYKIFDHLLKTVEAENKPLAREIGSATIESLKGFFGDMVHFVSGSRTSFALFAALTASLLILNPGKVVDTQNTIASNFNEAGGFTFGPNGEVIPVKVNPELNKNAQSWHWDVGFFGMYKHYTSDVFVSGPAHAAIDAVDTTLKATGDVFGQTPPEESVFSKTAKKIISSVADFLFGLNMLQNMTHAAFWLYMFNHGRRSGFRGASHILGLFSPLLDLGYRGVHRLSGVCRLPFMKDLPGHGATKAHLRAQIRQISERMSQQAPDENISAITALQNRPIIFKARGLSQTFELAAHNLNPLLDILEKFEQTITVASNPVGVENDLMRDQLIERIKAFRKILSGELDKPAKQLGALFSKIAAAETYHTGRTDIFKTVATRPASVHEYKALQSLGGLHAKRTKSSNITGKLRQISRESAYTFRGLATTVSNSIPHKLPLIYGLTAISALAAGLEVSGLSKHLLLQAQEPIGFLSQGFGALVGAIAPLPPFVVYNFFEDILAVHLAGGTTLLTAGAVLHYGLKLARTPSPKTP